jgi:hypothetical protein
VKLVHKLITGIKIKVISSSLNLIEFQLSKNGKYWEFLEIFAGKSGIYLSNRELKSFSQHKKFCANNKIKIFDKIERDKLPELARMIFESDVESVDLKEMKILFIYDNSNANATSEVLENLNNSSQFIGINTCLLDLSRYPNGRNDVEMLKYVREFSPTTIIFALHGNLHQDSNHILSIGFILEVKKDTGCSIAIVCFDIWRDSDLSFVRYWNDAATVFLHIDPIAVKRMKTFDLEDKFLLWPFPALQSAQRPLVSKDNKLIFSGSIKEQDRRFWLTNLNRIAIDNTLELFLIIFNYHRPKFRLSWSDYIENLSKSLVCISLGQKSNSHALVPGRTFDAITVGSLVFQQEINDAHPLSYFYNEYEHYFKFRCLCEIEYLINWVSCNIDSAQQIGAEARKFNNFHYSSERLWKYLYIKSEELK